MLKKVLWKKFEAILTSQPPNELCSEGLIFKTFYACNFDIVVIREPLLKGKAQYFWPPRTKQLRSDAFDNTNIIYFFTKQSNLMRRSTLLTLSLQVVFSGCNNQVCLSARKELVQLDLGNYSIEILQCHIWISTQKDQNWNFELEFKISERNETEIVHHQKGLNWTKMDEIFSLKLFITVAFSLSP